MELESLLNDKNFLQELAEAPNMDAMLAMFAEKGVTVTADELLKRTMPSRQELTDEELEDVAGGYVDPVGFYNWLRRALGLGSGRGSFGGGGHRF